MKVLWPFGIALRGEVPNHRLLRWLKTVVVSESGKGFRSRSQVGAGKTNASEPLLTCRNSQSGVETGVSSESRDESGGCALTGQMASGMQVA
jgi:hypothetical protein